jgi:hypothetical protein
MELIAYQPPAFMVGWHVTIMHYACEEIKEIM